MSYKPLQDDNSTSKNAIVVELQQVKAMSDATELDQLSTAQQSTEDLMMEDDASHSDLDQDNKDLLLSPLGEYNDYEEVLKAVGFGLGHILLIVGTGVALSSDAIELIAISFALPIIVKPSELNLSSWQIGLLSAILYVGSLTGGLVWGGIADINGRRLSLIASLTINGIFGVASAFSPNYAMLVIFRFISGVGVGGSIPVSVAYISEFIMAKYRGPCLGGLAFSWVIGVFICGVFAWGVLPLDLSLSVGSYNLHSWRIYIFMCGLPSLIGAVLFFIMPESPRFLLEVGDEQRSIKIFKRLHIVNNFHKQENLSSFSVKSIKLNPSSSNVIKAENKLSSYRERILLVLKGFREILRRNVQLFQYSLLRPTVILMITYFCLSFGSSGITLWYPTYIDRLSREALDSNVLHEDCNHTLSNYTINSTDGSLEDIFCSCPSTNYRNSIFYDVSLPSWWMMDASLYEMNIVEGRYEWVWFENVTMETVTFTQVTLHNAFICNSSWSNVQFVDVTFSNSSFCGINSNSTSFLSSIFINSSLNTVILDELSDSELNKLFNNRPDATNNRTVICDVIEPTGTCITEPAEVNLRQEYFYDLIIGISQFPGNVVSAIAVYFFRRSYWLSFIFLLSSFVVFLLFFVHVQVYSVLILCLFKAAITPGWDVSSLLTVEIYPTSLRSISSGFLLLMARIGAITGTYVFGAFSNTDLISIPILLTAGVLFVACVASIFLPKTNRKTALK